VINEQELCSLSPEDRLSAIRRLVALESADVAGAVVARSGSRRRTIALILIVLCCMGLAAWIGVLAVTLPHYYRTGGWRGAWVGFDLAELVAFAATGWAAWRRRQMLIICLVVLATLLLCDAWFDVVLDARTKGFGLSLTSALVIELPLALLAIAAAHRLLHQSFVTLWRYRGLPGPVPSLWKMPLLAGQPAPLRDLFNQAEAAGVVEQDGEADRVTADHGAAERRVS
jgi:hypothetical protein